MKGIVVVETQEEFDAWMAKKEPQYWSAVPTAKPINAKDTVGTQGKATIDTVVAQVIKH